MEIIKKNKNLNIDFVKLICAFGVICVHTQNSTISAELIGGIFSPFRIPFFLLSSLVFFISGLKNVDLFALANKIYNRVIIPYLVWTAIYFLLIVVKHYLTNQNSSKSLWGVLFYGESAIQLYYIPKMLILQGFTLAVMLILNQNIKRRIIGFIIFLVSFVWLYFGVTNNCFGFNGDYYAQIVLYIIIAFFISKMRDYKLFNYRYSIFGFMLFALILLNKYFISNYLDTSVFTIYFSFLGGVSLMFLALSLPSFYFPKNIQLILSFSYGIYLSHILFIEAFELVLKYLSVKFFYDVWDKLIFCIIIFCSSILFLSLVNKNPILKKYLIGG